MITENLSTLKIHKLTQEQYDRELEAGRVDPSAIYLTPDDGDNSNIYIQNEEPVDAEEGSLWVDMDAQGSSGGGSGSSAVAQPDWNAAEGKPGHVLNRTHWVESNGLVEILPETELSYDEAEQMFMIDFPINVEVGNSYLVTWNGVEYRSVVIDGATLGEPGTVALINEDANMYTGEGAVYAVILFPANGIGIAFDMAGSTEAVIAIKGEDVTVHKLPGKFLPDGVPYLEKGEMVEIPITGEWMQDDEGFVFASTAPFDLEIGETYTVIWNGYAYNTVAVDVSELMDGMPATGLMGDGIPFEFVSLGAEAAEMMGGMYVIVYGLDGAVAIFTIYRRATIAHTIDPRCLPDNEFVVNVDISTYPNVTADKNSNEIYAAVKNGKNVAIYMNGVILPCIRSEPNGAFFIMPSAQYENDEIIGVSTVSAWCIKPDGSVLVS